MYPLIVVSNMKQFFVLMVIMASLDPYLVKKKKKNKKQNKTKQLATHTGTKTAGDPGVPCLKSKIFLISYSASRSDAG